MVPLILNLGTGWRCLTYAPATLFLGKEPRYTMNKTLGGPQNRRGLCEEKKTSVYAGNQTWFSGRLSHSVVTKLTEVFRLPQDNSN
jgi:hypothetical protein